MLQLILSFIYDVAKSIDKKFGWYEDYSYETAPYCGHHYSGHNGRLTEASYHEGEGGKSLGNELIRMYKTTQRNSKWVFCSQKGQNFMKWVKGWNIHKSGTYAVLITHRGLSTYTHSGEFRGWVISVQKLQNSQDGQFPYVQQIHKPASKR